MKLSSEAAYRGRSELSPSGTWYTVEFLRWAPFTQHLHLAIHRDKIILAPICLAVLLTTYSQRRYRGISLNRNISKSPSHHVSIFFAPHPQSSPRIAIFLDTRLVSTHLISSQQQPDHQRKRVVSLRFVIMKYSSVLAGLSTLAFVAASPIRPNGPSNGKSTSHFSTCVMNIL